MSEYLTISDSYWNGSRALNKRMNGRGNNSGFYFIFNSFFNNSGLFHSLQQELCYCLNSSYCLSQCRLVCFLQIFHGNTENIITVTRVNAFSRTRQMWHSHVPKKRCMFNLPLSRRYILECSGIYRSEENEEYTSYSYLYEIYPTSISFCR